MSINDIANFLDIITGYYDYNKMPQELWQKLERIAKKLFASHNVKLLITSHYRTPAQNVKCGGSPTSAHLTGYAVDIACHTSDIRYALVQYALEDGIKRIGIYDRHIHIDVDFNKPQDVIWLGKSK